MAGKIQQVLKYLKYLGKAKTKHGIHSPFIYDLVTKVIDDNIVYPAYRKVEDQRNKLLRNRNLLEIVDFGASAGRAGYTTAFERVKDIASRSSITPKQGQLLYRLVKYFKPEIMLELGTSLGISSIYQVSGSPESFFIGIEGCAATAAIAEENLNKFSDAKSYSIVIGNFNNTLSGVLEKLDKLDYAFIDGNHAYKPTVEYFKKILPYTHEYSMIIIHDIYWSKGMEQAWDEIRKNPMVTITVDLYSMGLVFFRKGLPKQDFIIRF